MDLTIVGAGPAALALAAGCLRKGCRVLLYRDPSHGQHLDSVLATGLELRGVLIGNVALQSTTDLSQAVAFARLIVLAVPSTVHTDLLHSLARYDLREHILMAMPGNAFTFLDAFDFPVRNIIETNLSPYSCRMDDGALLVYGIKRKIYASTLRRIDEADVRAMAQSVMPIELHWCSNAIEVSLANVNGIFHPLMMLMNGGRVEDTAGNFKLYADGLTPAVAKAMICMDEVRLQISTALRFPARSALEISNDCYGQEFSSLVELARGSPPHNQLRAPDTMRHRNLDEDIPDLLVFWHGLAEVLGIDASALSVVITLAGMATGLDYMEQGRSLRNLNLGGKFATQLRRSFGEDTIASRLREAWEGRCFVGSQGGRASYGGKARFTSNGW